MMNNGALVGEPGEIFSSALQGPIREPCAETQRQVH
jgi:hypothetical protein